MPATVAAMQCSRRSHHSAGGPKLSPSKPGSN